MKLTIVILSTIISLQSFGQKWQLNNVDETKEFGYEYSFQFENLDDTCTYQLTEKSGNQTSTFELYDNIGDTILFANIKIRNIKTDSIIKSYSDLNGTTSIQLEKGKYKIEVSAIKYDKFELEFEIKRGEFIELKIKLGLAPELEVFQINSRTKLEESEIIEIIDCFKTYRIELQDNCSDKNKYFITMQI